MRILLDENLDWRLSRALPGHEVQSVTGLGWAGIQNGLLLKKAQETGFEVLVTMDSKMSFQQNLIGQLIHHVGRIREHGNRPLRVVFNSRANPVRIITVYFDRKMKDRV